MLNYLGLWWVKAVIVAGALAAAAAGGAAVNGWRLQAEFATEKEAKVERIHELELVIERQNSAVALLGQAKATADEFRTRAEREAAAARNASVKHDEWVSTLTGSCADNLKEMWSRP